MADKNEIPWADTYPSADRSDWAGDTQVWECLSDCPGGEHWHAALRTVGPKGTCVWRSVEGYTQMETARSRALAEKQKHLPRHDPKDPVTGLAVKHEREITDTWQVSLAELLAMLGHTPREGETCTVQVNGRAWAESLTITVKHAE